VPVAPKHVDVDDLLDIDVRIIGVLAGELLAGGEVHVEDGSFRLADRRSAQGTDFRTPTSGEIEVFAQPGATSPQRTVLAAAIELVVVEAESDGTVRHCLPHIGVGREIVRFVEGQDVEHEPSL
jgi:hypothetical protein